MGDDEITQRLRNLIKDAAETGDATAMFKGMRELFEKNPLPYSEAARQEAWLQLSNFKHRWARLPSHVQPWAQEIIASFGDLSARAQARSSNAHRSLAEKWQGGAIVDNQIMGRDDPDGFSVAVNPKMSNITEVLHDTLDMLTVYGRRLAYLCALSQIAEGKAPRLETLQTFSIRSLEDELKKGRMGLSPELLLGDEYYQMRNALAHGGAAVNKRARQITFTARARGGDRAQTRTYPFVDFVVSYKHLVHWMIVFTIFKALEATVLAEIAYRVNLGDSADE